MIALHVEVASHGLGAREGRRVEDDEAESASLTGDEQHPLTILSTLPSAGVGVLLGLRLFPMELSVIALIGIVLLIGIVKKNGILMVDFALEAERESGLSTREALYEACLLRFRPILITTLAAMLGGAPGRRHGDRLRAAAAPRVAIIGGLTLSQLLTLFTRRGSTWSSIG